MATYWQNDRQTVRTFKTFLQAQIKLLVFIFRKINIFIKLIIETKRLRSPWSSRIKKEEIGMLYPIIILKKEAQRCFCFQRMQGMSFCLDKVQGIPNHWNFLKKYFFSKNTATAFVSECPLKVLSSLTPGHQLLPKG